MGANRRYSADHPRSAQGLRRAVFAFLDINRREGHLVVPKSKFPPLSGKSAARSARAPTVPRRLKATGATTYNVLRTTGAARKAVSYTSHHPQAREGSSVRLVPCWKLEAGAAGKEREDIRGVRRARAPGSFCCDPRTRRHRRGGKPRVHGDERVDGRERSPVSVERWVRSLPATASAPAVGSRTERSVSSPLGLRSSSASAQESRELRSRGRKKDHRLSQSAKAAQRSILLRRFLREVVEGEPQNRIVVLDGCARCCPSRGRDTRERDGRRRRRRNGSFSTGARGGPTKGFDKITGVSSEKRMVLGTSTR
jgi:hypothetical protein